LSSKLRSESSSTRKNLQGGIYVESSFHTGVIYQNFSKSLLAISDKFKPICIDTYKVKDSDESPEVFYKHYSSHSQYLNLAFTSWSVSAKIFSLLCVNFSQSCGEKKNSNRYSKPHDCSTFHCSRNYEITLTDFKIAELPAEVKYETLVENALTTTEYKRAMDCQFFRISSLSNSVHKHPLWPLLMMDNSLKGLVLRHIEANGFQEPMRLRYPEYVFDFLQVILLFESDLFDESIFSHVDMNSIVKIMVISALCACTE
jgi:hypothetical protein